MSMPPLSFARYARAVSGCGMVLATTAFATWQDEIGYTRLAQELGSALPTGAGVSVSLVEATLTPDGGEYLPSNDPAPSFGNFAGKVFGFRSGVSPVSFHAVRVGSFFFGANTNPLVGDASVAPRTGSGPAATVDCYEADRWLGEDFLRLGEVDRPRLETQAIGNHSWIGSVGSDFSAAEANDSLRRLDWAVAASDHVAVVGLNNGAGTVVPPLLGAAFNVLSVGRTDGAHSTGTTPAEVDGAGRAKPELVAPLTATSWSTAVVSSCAAILVEAGAGVSPQARRSELVRALLLAGARKDPFPAWAQTTTRPLDPHFGAGEVNVWRSHRILVAGEVADGSSSAVARSGWHFANGIVPGQARAYGLEIPEGCVASELAAALVWNRTIATATPMAWIDPSPTLANLDLRLLATAGSGPDTEVARSESGSHGSVPHPLEYLYVRETAAGRYTLRVDNAAAGSGDTAYGLAWFLSLAPAAPPESGFQWNTHNQSLTLTFSRLGVGLTYALEASADLLSWHTELTLTPASPTTAVTIAGPSARAFYRLLWKP